MSLTQFISDIGRPVAYYPSIRKITFTTNASILLCQLLYWSDKTTEKNGWIYKTSSQLEEETGLTYDEQKTARAKLVELQLIEEKYDRLNHEMNFKVDKDLVNKRWEEANGRVYTPKVEIKQEKKVEENYIIPPIEQGPAKTEKRGDFIQLIKDQREWPGFKISETKKEVKSKLAVRLRINPDGKKWENFIDYAAGQQIKYSQTIDKFIDWAITEGFNPIYWTPEKMKTLWPQAFVPEEKPKQNLENFVSKLPEVKEEKYVPMPSRINKKLD